MKKYYFIGIGMVVAVAAIPLIPLESNRQEWVNPEIKTPVQQVEIKSGPRVEIGTTTIMVDIASSTAAVKRGLSGRLSLPFDRGMLFLFPNAQIYSFWMPDMHFDIDIIWINKGKIVDISMNASSKFDPLNPIFYRPKSPASEVIEVNTGYAKEHSIRVGDGVSYLDILDL